VARMGNVSGFKMITRGDMVVLDTWWRVMMVVTWWLTMVVWRCVFDGVRWCMVVGGVTIVEVEMGYSGSFMVVSWRCMAHGFKVVVDVHGEVYGRSKHGSTVEDVW